MKEKFILFDSSTLISFAMNGLLPELNELKKIFKGKFIITKEVKQEVVDKPLTMKRFELEALKIEELLNEKILELPSSIGITDSEISKETKNILDTANNTFYARDRPISLIDAGEASCLGLSKILKSKKMENVVAVDERTARMLCERPENLKRLFEKKLHTKIQSKEENYKFFRGINFIRSSELIYVAYKKKLLKLKGSKVLDAMLYALKFKGCAISEEEIEEIKAIK